MHRARASAVILLLPLLVLIAAACEPEPPSPEPTGPPPPSATATATSSDRPSPRPDESGPPGVPEAVWTLLSPNGPAPGPRFGHTWTVDPSAGLAYLFGGHDATAPLDDLWVYDQTADRWSVIATVGSRPSARAGHVAGWVDDVGLVIAGGRDADDAPLADVWRFDPERSTWMQLSIGDPRPVARSGACSTVDPSGGLWITHGLGTAPLADTWRLDPTTSRWTAAKPTGDIPSARSEATCWWTAADGLALLGGHDGGTPQDDAWVLDDPETSSAEWTHAAIDVAVAARSAAAAARQGDAIVIVGGVGSDAIARGDVVRIDLETMAVEPFWTRSDGPAPRSGAALVDDPAAERLLLFGGATDDSAPSGELWQLDP